MAFLPPPPNAAPDSPGLALALGSAAALASAFVVGLISGLTNIQFAFLAVLIGALVGLAMRRGGSNPALPIMAAIIALAGSAVSSLISFIVRLVKAGHIPLSYVLGHLSTVISDVPHYIGPIGFLFWGLAAYIGWSTASGRGRRMRRPAFGPRGPVSYGGPAQQPYGAPPAPGQQPFPGQQPYGAPADQAPGTFGQPGFSAPDLVVPPDQPPGSPMPPPAG